MIHRDVNPTNIAVSAAGRPVLIDFDLAVLAADHQTLEPDGPVVGTLGYMAPEQTGRTGRAVDQRADLYTLGATLYEMATGRTPFEEADTLQLIHDHLVREPVAPSQVDARVPRGLSNIIMHRNMHAYLFAAPARAWQIQRIGISSEDAAPLIAELESCRSWFEGRAADQPYNFLHLLLLVQAEQAWACGDVWKAAITFDEAVVEAEARQRPWHRALITERAAR